MKRWILFWMTMAALMGGCGGSDSANAVTEATDGAALQPQVENAALRPPSPPSL